MATRSIEPYRDSTMPERFMRWLEVLRERIRTIPCFFQGDGSPEGVIVANKGDRYYDETDLVEYIKSTDGGNTGWLLQGGGGGMAGLGIWRYRTATGATPATGRLQFDNVSIAAATNLYINATNDGSTDMTNFLSLVAVNDLLYIQVQADAGSWVVVQVGSAGVAAGVFTFGITNVIAQGTAPSNNTPVAVVLG